MVNPHPGNTVLADAENIIIVPLYSVTVVYTNLFLRFLPWEYDPETDEEREICCTRLSNLPSLLDPRPNIPILFEIIGQISSEDCFLTADGYEHPVSSGQADEHLATCWIETRDEYISRVYWHGIVPAVQEIARHIPGNVDTSRLLGEVDGEAILQVCYQPPAGQNIASTLPFYDVDGVRQVPSTIAEIPFEQPVRVTFALQCCYCRGDPDSERVLIAVLEHMANI